MRSSPVFWNTMDAQRDLEDASVNEAESMHEEKSHGLVHSYLDTCPVCCLPFHTREPKLLPCLHSFCKNCLPPPSRNLFMTPNQENKALNVLRCPVCRQECMAMDVMDNVFVKDSAEAPSSTIERNVQLCMTCDDNTEAVAFCVDCAEYLCPTCVEAHQRVKFTKDHVIKHRSDDFREVCSVSTWRPMLCEIHKQEPVKLFCETCDLLTCRDCQLIKHKDHKYQFLEDAYTNHKQHMETMTHRLQEKKKLIAEVSDSIENGLFQVDKSHTAAQNEIKKAICSLVLEINKKGKMLVNQLKAVTKDHERVLLKQQEDIGFLSRHLDHVISFTKWATAKNGGAALLHYKRLIQFQIENLLQAKCSVAFIPRSSVSFQSRASYWASNVDLGSVMVESVPGLQFGGFQGIPHQPPLPGHGTTHSFSSGTPHSTLAQLQMQVDKLNPQADRQPQQLSPPWTLYQSVRLQPTVPGPLQGAPNGVPPLTGHRSMVPPPSHTLLRGMVNNSGRESSDAFPSSSVETHDAPPSTGDISISQSQQTIYGNKRRNSDDLVDIVKPNYLQSLSPVRSIQRQQTSPGCAAVTREEKPSATFFESSDKQNWGKIESSAAKKRRTSETVLVKHDLDDDCHYDYANQKASLPDSTDDQFPVSSQSDEKEVWSDDKAHGPSWLVRCKTRRLDCVPMEQKERSEATLEEASCAVCEAGGELLACRNCAKVFHLTCHVPSLLKSPSGEWFCSFCCDLQMSEMGEETEKVKKEKTLKECYPDGQTSWDHFMRN